MKRVMILAVLGLLVSAPALMAADVNEQDQRIQELEKSVAELRAQLNEQSVDSRNVELLREMVKDMGDNGPSVGQDSTLTAGYDNRFYIRRADDMFRLQIDTLMQLRHTYATTDDCDDDLMQDGTRAPFGQSGVDNSSAGAELERARLYLTGHVLKDVDYRIVFEADDDGGDQFLYEYEVGYAFMPELGVRAGRYKGPFGKQEITSSGRLMMIDRSLANEVFNIDRMSGAEIFGTIDLGDVQPVYRAGIFNGLATNNARARQSTDNSPAVAGRLAVPLMGATEKDFANESDLQWHKNPVAMVGTSFAYSNDRVEDTWAGGDGRSFTFLGKNPDDCKSDVYALGGEVTQFGADVSYKYAGLSMTLEGFYQHVDVDSGEVAYLADGFGNGRSVAGPMGELIAGESLDNYGWYGQAGYFLVKDIFEVAGRVGSVCVDGTNDSYEYAAGWNWYLAGQDLKLSMDVTYIDDLPMRSSSANFDGIENNSLVLVRTQLQFQF